MMNLILNIDTAGENAAVSLSAGEKGLAFRVNNRQQDHATWLHPAIQELCKETGHTLSELNAVAVSNGPGSYTGLRVGLAAAKGLCYAGNLPLITLSTLQIMAATALADLGLEKVKGKWLCPMIDARREEVYYALYDQSLNIIHPPSALILQSHSFSEAVQQEAILFFGNGSPKFKTIISGNDVLFANPDLGKCVEIMPHLSNLSFQQKKFASLSLAEPFYIKEFYFAGRKD